MISGIDVSSYQGKSIDWSKVAAAGNRFAIVKVSEGDKVLDPTRMIDLSGAKAAGLYTGIYHFAHPASGDGATQAQKLFDNCGGTMPDLPPALDLESTGGLGSEAVLAFTRDFIEACEALFGKKPLLYTGSWFWTALGSDGVNATDIAECPLWTAEYAHGASWTPSSTDHPDAQPAVVIVDDLAVRVASADARHRGRGRPKRIQRRRSSASRAVRISDERRVRWQRPPPHRSAASRSPHRVWACHARHGRLRLAASDL